MEQALLTHNLCDSSSGATTMAAKNVHWSKAEVRCLLKIWADPKIQELFDKKPKNSKIFAEIRKYLTDWGYHRTDEQCREKVKKLRKRYIRVREALQKPGSSSHVKLKFHFYDAVDAILGSKLSTGPSVVVESASQQNSTIETSLSGENVKCELKDQEPVPQLLQDIHPVTLPEPCSSSQGESGDYSLSQSPMPVISNVTSYKSIADANSYSRHPIPSSVSSPVPGSSAQVTKAIANFLIMDLHPPTLVAGKGFIKLIHSLFPSYTDFPSPFVLEGLLTEHRSKVKKSLADMLRTSNNGEMEKKCDYSEPIENGCRRHMPPPKQQGEVPYCVTLSGEVWEHSWGDDKLGYVTLWAHYIDTNFNCHNVCLATQRLIESATPDNSPQSLEIQVKIMAQEWGISHINLILLGGKDMNQIRLKPRNKEKCAGSVPRPNSTTCIEKERAVPFNKSLNLKCNLLSEGLQIVPCFYSVVQSCIETVMSHHVVSKTLSYFQGVLFTLLQPPRHSSPLLNHQSVSQTLSEEEELELNSWAKHCQLTWYRLYPVLSTLLKHKSLIMDCVKEFKCANLPDEGIASPSSSFNIWTNSKSASSNTEPSHSEWRIVEELSSVLKPLDVACQTLAKETFPRLSLMKPILTGLFSRHLVCRPGDSVVLKQVKETVRQMLGSQYCNQAVNRVLCVACALDPQFHGLGFMEKMEQNNTFEWLKKQTIRIAEEDGKARNTNSRCRKRSQSSDPPESETYFLRSKRLKQSHLINLSNIGNEGENKEEDADETELAEPDSKGEVSGIEFLLGDLFSTTRRRQHTVEESVDIELSMFMAGEGAPFGIEPLQWWRTKAVQFPLLAKVALGYLAAPAVVGDMARHFVEDRAQAIKRNRHNIPPASLDTVLFLHYNHMHTSDFSCS
ncbi:uncharacterized protein LOC133506131 [Syngnathoides biaculeatus]|uniref:uncharacterized protein LOC133506131 n=1 Tax=Syngnathoides biaculeatus TaxID=300417 RepID=UPI002ADDA7E0|nr:uncharacterized protein LOC133506131 [Syngnathoides biaculeatus]